MPPRPSDPLARFYTHVNLDGPVPERYPELGPCHDWTSGTKDGYGKFWDAGTHRAHLWLWRRKRGPVPPGHVLDHFACDRRLCVNLDHCRPVTNRENLLRSDLTSAAINRAKGACPEGHAYDEENTYVDPRTGIRSCRICRRKASREYAQRRRERARLARR